MEAADQSMKFLSKEEKILIFAHNLYQPAQCIGGVFKPRGKAYSKTHPLVVSASLLADFEDGTFRPSEFILLKKSLSSISRDEMEILMRMRYTVPNDHHFSIEALEEGITVITKEIVSGYQIRPEIINWCQKNGYAMPYENWSIAELTEAGIYKFIS